MRIPWFLDVTNQEITLRSREQKLRYAVLLNLLAEQITMRHIRADMGKLWPAGQVRPAGPFILARRRLPKLKFSS